jgi:hypothetical protein
MTDTSLDGKPSLLQSDRYKLTWKDLRSPYGDLTHGSEVKYLCPISDQSIPHLRSGEA